MPSYPAENFNRFSTLATMSGYEVVDERGHPVAEREDRQSASGVAFMLNRAAADGGEALAKTIAKLR